MSPISQLNLQGPNIISSCSKGEGVRRGQTIWRNMTEPVQVHKTKYIMKNKSHASAVSSTKAFRMATFKKSIWINTENKILKDYNK